MRHLFQSSSGLVRTWWFWAFVLLAIPNCMLTTTGTGCPGDPDCKPDPAPCDEPKCMDQVFFPGTNPSDAVFCEIPIPLAEGDKSCADDADVAAGYSLSEAATLLATGQPTKFIALDYSDEAVMACGGTGPKKIEFFGGWPDGLRTCIDCDEKIGDQKQYPDPLSACIAKCTDLVNQSSGPFPADVPAYCKANTRIATNLEPTICQPGACTQGGNVNMSWVDPRWSPTPLTWIDELGGAASNGTNTLTRESMATGNTDDDFNAGAASLQIIFKGDAWVDFEAGFPMVSHLLGLRESCGHLLSCPDNEPNLKGIGVSLNLHANGNLYALEANNQPLQVTQIPGQTYALGERFRVRATDNHDKTATISFSRLTAPCADGTICAEDPPFYTSPIHLHYPLQVDATLREQNAALVNVNIVFIWP